MSQLRVALRKPGAKAGFDALAVFGAEREGFTFTDAEVPEGVKPPLECPSYRDPPPPEFDGDNESFNFWRHVERRPTLGHPPWDDYERTTSLRAQWYRFDDPPRADDGARDPYALVTLCDTMPGAVSERVGPVTGACGSLQAPISPVRLFGEVRSDWVLAVNRARLRGRRLRVGRHGDLGRRRGR